MNKPSLKQFFVLSLFLILAPTKSLVELGDGPYKDEDILNSKELEGALQGTVDYRRYLTWPTEIERLVKDREKSGHLVSQVAVQDRLIAEQRQGFQDLKDRLITQFKEKFPDVKLQRDADSRPSTAILEAKPAIKEAWDSKASDTRSPDVITKVPDERPSLTRAATLTEREVKKLLDQRKKIEEEMLAEHITTTRRISALYAPAPSFVSTLPRSVKALTEAEKRVSALAASRASAQQAAAQTALSGDRGGLGKKLAPIEKKSFDRIPRPKGKK